MLSLSPIKLLLVAAVIMLLMGPDKLPEMAHRIGSSWRALKRLQERMESEVREAIPDLLSRTIAEEADTPPCPLWLPQATTLHRWAWFIP